MFDLSFTHPFDKDLQATFAGIMRGLNGEMDISEVLALHLLDNQSARATLENHNVNVSALGHDLSTSISRLPRFPNGYFSGSDANPSVAYQRILQRACIAAYDAGAEEVSGADVLVAMLGEKNSHVVHLLELHGGQAIRSMVPHVDKMTAEALAYSAAEQAIFLWQGFMESGALTARELDQVGGHAGAPLPVAAHAIPIARALAALHKDTNFPDVFEFQVTEAMGDWLRKHPTASPQQYQAELDAAVANFFEVDAPTPKD